MAATGVGRLRPDRRSQGGGSEVAVTPSPTSVRLRFEDRMRDADALAWSIEKDPMLRSTIIAVLVLDRRPRPGPGGRPPGAGQPPGAPAAASG